MQDGAGSERLYGLDWLRIGAFALLIFYHIGMFFVPWEWHVKTAQPLAWLELPMMALSPWRLPLLFLISGVASRVMLRKLGGPAGFATSRSGRLLLPLAAGMAMFVAPQPWAELRAAGVYQGSFWQFWTEEYFRFGDFQDLLLPTWNHLWFVAYLWAYSLALASLATLPAPVRRRLQPVFDRCFAGRRLLLLPVIYLAAARLLLFPLFGETHALLDDPYAHAVYGFAFFFGVGLAGSACSWRTVAQRWQSAAKLAIAAYAVIILLDLTIPGEARALELAVLRIARAVQAWAAIIALLGLARVHLHRDGPVRRYLTDAIFAYYIAHQTIIVLVGFAVAPMGLGSGLEFAVILAATVIGCAITYELGRRVTWLRPLIGLKPHVRGQDPVSPQSVRGFAGEDGSATGHAG